MHQAHAEEGMPNNNNDMRVAIVAGLFLIGTSLAGTFFQGCQSANQRRQEFQANVVLTCLGGENVEQNMKCLDFVVSLNLIEDKNLVTSIDSLKSEEVPIIRLPWPLLILSDSLISSQ